MERTAEERKGWCIASVHDLIDGISTVLAPTLDTARGMPGYKHLEIQVFKQERREDEANACMDDGTN